MRNTQLDDIIEQAISVATVHNAVFIFIEKPSFSCLRKQCLFFPVNPMKCLSTEYILEAGDTQ
jgi:hypothetical protein